MANYPLIHCDKDDPDACPICLEKGQITYKVIEGTRACPRHGGNSQLESLRKQSANQYRLQIWQKRVEEFTESEHAKSLRGEIGILKLTLESVLNSCQTASDLLMYSTKIGDLVTRIEKTVASCDRLERNMGMSLDKSTAMKLAADIVELIAEHVQEPETIDAISSGLIDLLGKL